MTHPAVPTVPLYVLTKCYEALKMAKDMNDLTTRQWEIIVDGWSCLSWRVDAILEAQKVEVTE